MPRAERFRRAKNAEAYGDSPAVESLNATVLVENSLSKAPISLRFPVRAGPARMRKLQSNQGKSRAFLQL
jgi:hypothetical protein